MRRLISAQELEVMFKKGKAGNVQIKQMGGSKIVGDIQLMVDGRKYNVRVEEEGTFRTVSATNQVGNLESNSDREKEDAEVDKRFDDMDASKNDQENLVDDMEIQGNKILNDRGKINEEVAKESGNKEEEAEKARNNGLNDSHFSGKEILQALQGAETLGKPDSNYIELAKDSSQIQNTEAQAGENQDQGKDGRGVENNSLQCISNIPVRASQVCGINLHVDLIPSAVRRNVRSQQLEASENSKREGFAEYINASQQQEQNEIDKELQKTIAAGNSLGIKFGNPGIKRMKKMIENEAKALKASLKDNSFAPLMRDD
ncbi:hypothetical protein RHSIM_Rhsim09G0015100 [Rhododendron simsii]|uniref:Uncharacterized protein n=1 Tax=Rhododendron simsii TaxID=118357 RepID=A0A834LE30_RHOSS|nr:hypothetical protein RHSIM_Rhsim09G0015100 [Rhododendron simsii]